MTSQEEVKKLLSSLIISSAKGLTVRRLFIDYKNEIGRDVPFQKFGFVSFEAYLRSIPDTCVVHGCGVTAVVEPVINDKVKHINDMILKQKPSKTKKRFPEPRRYRGVEIASSKPQPPKPIPSLLDIDKIELPMNLDNMRSGLPPAEYYYSQNKSKSNQIPRFYKTKPESFTDKTTRRSYNENETYNETVSPQFHKSRFQNSNNCFDSCQSYESSNKSYYLNNKTNPGVANNTNPGIANNTNPIFANRNTNSVVSNSDTNSYNVSPGNDMSMGLIKMLNTFKKGKMIQNTLQNNISNIPTKSSTDDDPSTSRSTESNSERRNNSHSSNDDKYSELYFSDDSFDEMIYQSDDDEILDVESELRQLRIIKDAVEENVQETNKRLPSFPLDKYVSSRVNEKVKRNLTILISEHPDGIWCSRLALLYKERFREELDPFEFGFSCMSQMCEDLCDIFHMIRPGKMDWKIFDKRRPPPEKNEVQEWCEYIKKFISKENKTPNEPSVPTDFQVTPKQPKINYPDGVLHLSDTIEFQWIEDGIQEMKYVEIIVSEVYDPSKFWVQLKTESSKLEKMMNEIQDFYSINKDEYKLKREDCYEGLIIASIFFGEFHRAKISKIYPDDTLKVFYFDYGTVCDVSITKAYFLHQQFGTLPQQAIRARLANIMPTEKNTMWPITASRRFLELIKNKNLVGLLTYIDVENLVLSMIITDVTADDVDVHVNDVLVDEGYAAIGNKADICETSSAIVPNVHLYPTFDDLENGKCPTFADLQKFHKLGFSNELIFKDYFDPYKTKGKNEEVSFNDSASQVAELIDLQSGSQTSSNTLTTMGANKNAKSYKTLELELKVENGMIQTSLPQECESSKLKVETFLSKELKEFTPKVETFVPKKFYGLNTKKDEAFSSKKVKEPKSETFLSTKSNSSSNKTINIVDTSKISDSIPLSVESTLLRMKHEENKSNDSPVTKTPAPVHPIPKCKRPPPGFESVIPNQNQNSFTPSNPQPSVNFLNLQHLVNDNVLTNNQITNLIEMDNASTYLNYMLTVDKICKQNANIANMIAECHNIFKMIKDTNISENARNALMAKYMENVQRLNMMGSQNVPKTDKSPTSEPTLDENSQAATAKTIQEYTKNNRYIFKKTFMNLTIHIIHVENQYYMSTQEVISVLIGSSELFFTWLRNNGYQSHEFPSKAFSFSTTSDIYNELIKYNIIGIQNNKSTGLIIRLTLLKDVVVIIEKHSTHSVLKCIQYILHECDRNKTPSLLYSE